MLWGSNWPHPNETSKPDDALVFDLMSKWAPDDATRRLLVSQSQDGIASAAKLEGPHLLQVFALEE